MPFKSALDQGVCVVAVHVPILRPDLGSEPDSPFARDAQNKLVRRSYWLDMNDLKPCDNNDEQNWCGINQR